MPRQACLDALPHFVRNLRSALRPEFSTGLLPHVLVRGIEWTQIFRTEADRADFVARVAVLAGAHALTVYPWALLPHHAHLLVQTGTIPLAASMRKLLTGYVGNFNRRHKRVGHLVQNRYRSIVVEAEPYLRELVRYLHLNPLRAEVVPDLRRLARYPWTGHSALLGTVPCPWQDTTTVLAQFGGSSRGARAAPMPLDALVARVCRHVGLLPAHLATRSRRPAASRARAGIAYLWTVVLGHPGRPLAPAPRHPAAERLWRRPAGRRRRARVAAAP